MDIRGCVSTDAGAHKELCSDAAVLKIATSGRYGRIGFAVLCDGLDGMTDAWKASAIVAERFAAWFHGELPAILQKAEADMRERERGKESARMLTEVLQAEDRRRSYSKELFALAGIRIRKRLREIAAELEARIAGYKRLHGRVAGCAATCLLVMGGSYLVMHIGPSRAYLAEGQDLSLLEQEADVPEQKTSPFGTKERARPLFLQGAMSRDTGILLCSDAFVRRQNPEHFCKKINRCIRHSEKRQETVLRGLTRYVRRRGERQDAFAVLLTRGR